MQQRRIGKGVADGWHEFLETFTEFAKHWQSQQKLLGGSQPKLK